MNSKTTKTSKTKIGCSDFAHMPCMDVDMIRMMEKCCPSMEEKFSNRENIQAMMEACCGAMVNQTETSTSSQNNSGNQKDKKSSNTCCS